MLTLLKHRDVLFIAPNCLKNHDFKKVFDHDSTVDLLKTFYLKVSRNHHTLI